jgi:hypothetical protein
MSGSQFNSSPSVTPAHPLDDLLADLGAHLRFIRLALQCLDESLPERFALALDGDRLRIGACSVATLTPGLAPSLRADLMLALDRDWLDEADDALGDAAGHLDDALAALDRLQEVEDAGSEAAP